MEIAALLVRQEESVKFRLCDERVAASIRIII